jgi:hypothetical protein
MPADQPDDFYRFQDKAVFVPGRSRMGPNPQHLSPNGDKSVIQHDMEETMMWKQPDSRDHTRPDTPDDSRRQPKSTTSRRSGEAVPKLPGSGTQLHVSTHTQR